MLDLRNCFGLINLDVLFKILNNNTELDSISPYINLVYGNESHLFFSLTSERKILFADGIANNGLFQGEIMASLAACLVIIEVIIISSENLLPTEKNSLTIASIIDDMTIHAPAEVMIKFLSNFNTNLNKLNTGSINLNKSYLLPPTEAQSCLALKEYQILAKTLTATIDNSINSINYIQVKMAISLGIPHGDTNFMIENLENKSIELTRAFSRITQYPRKQFQYHLVKLCIAGTPTSLIRQLRPSLTIPHLISKFHSETLR